MEPIESEKVEIDGDYGSGTFAVSAHPSGDVLVTSHAVGAGWPDIAWLSPKKARKMAKALKRAATAAEGMI